MDDFSAGGIHLLPFAAIVSTEYNTHGNLYSTVTIKPFEPSYLEKPAIHRVNSIYRQPLFLRLLAAVNKEMEFCIVRTSNSYICFKPLLVGGA